jgi:hypothetical protein
MHSGRVVVGAASAGEVGMDGGADELSFTPSGEVSAKIKGATNSHVLTIDQMPRHNHKRGGHTDDWGAGGNQGYVGGDQNRGDSNAYQPTFNGNNQPHSHDMSESSAPITASFTGTKTTASMPLPLHRKHHYIIKH